MHYSKLPTKLGSVLLIFLFISSCNFFTESETTDNSTITGQVFHEATGDPVPDAIVRITEPQIYQESTVTDNNGRFIFSNINIETEVQLTIEFTKDNFHTTTRLVNASPGEDLVIENIQMSLLSEDPPDEPDEVSGEPAGAASLLLANISEQSINIQETGGVVNSALTFVVQDSSGRAVEAGQTVYFEIVSGPDGGEELTPLSAQTDGSGSVTTNLLSGYAAGVVKVEAKIERDDIGLTIRSKPITLTIHGGYPDQDYFSIAVTTSNFEAMHINGNRNLVSVIAGDKFSNPVKPGTPVYFHTSGGIIQGSDITNNDGEVQVDLISGNPRPADGYVTVTAHTFDEDDNMVFAEIPVLFSGAPSPDKIIVTPETFNVPVGGAVTYSLTVTDENDNPLPARTSVSVELENEILTLSGDTDFTIPNALYSGPGVTEFSFSVRDHDDENMNPQSYDITVYVETPGGFSARRTFSD
jgi:hypothetical protein